VTQPNSTSRVPASHGICELDVEGNVRTIDETAAYFLGTCREQAQGKPIHDVLAASGIDEPAHASKDCPFAHAIREGRMWYAQGVADAGLSVGVELFMVQAPLYSGREVSGAVLIVGDIRFQASRQMAQFSRYVDIAAHELRNPATAILGLAEWLERHYTATTGSWDTSVQHAVGSIVIEARRLHELLTHYMGDRLFEDLATRISPRNVDLTAIVDEEADAARRRHPEMTIDGPSSSGGAVFTDPDRLREVLVNLLDNAAKYAGPAPRVRIRVCRSANASGIEIADDGPGLPVSVRRRMEECQSPAARSGARDEGLGLFISKQIVARLGGQFSVESPGVGGARFRISLPRVPHGYMG